MSTTPISGAAALPAATTAAAATTAPAASASAPTTAATQQAATGAAQAQPKAEAFNAPALELPPDPTTREVMSGLVGAMADPSVNDTSAQRLFELHQQLLEAEKAMIAAYVSPRQ